MKFCRSPIRGWERYGSASVCERERRRIGGRPQGKMRGNPSVQRDSVLSDTEIAVRYYCIAPFPHQNGSISGSEKM